MYSRSRIFYLDTFLLMQDFFQNDKVPNAEIDLSLFGIEDYTLHLKREDLLHPEMSGNKFRKLKYNLVEAQEQGKDTLLTFGGAYSNHIAAVAAAGKEFGFKTIGIIRGEELAEKRPLNPTLAFAEACGMKLHFISREEYRRKEDPNFLEALKTKFGDFYLLPEGGTNALAVKGCVEILKDSDFEYDYVCTAVGTGGTLVGIIEASKEYQKIIGFSVLQGDFQTSEIQKYSHKKNFEITDFYSFGGYGKIDEELIRFINRFREMTLIPLDPIYTGKMMYGVLDLLKRKYFKKNSRILAVHSGGLQGIAGANELLQRKRMPLIQ